MKKSKGRRQKQKKLGTARRKANRQILPALAAVGSACGLAATPASALELGDIRVDSTLGQPLRASIAYALAPNEELYNYCIFLRPGYPSSGIPAVRDARITVTDNVIVLNGRVPIREPLLSLQLTVDCAYTAHLAREYTLMLDPALPSEGELAPLSTGRPDMTPLPAARVTASEVPAEIRPAPVVRRTTRRPKDVTPIAAEDRYLVQPGDSLSQIVARIENRNVPLWPAVEAVFTANPHAFLDNDPNLLKAGSWLDIPDLSGTDAVAAGDGGTRVGQQPAQSRPTAVYSGPAVPEPAAESRQAADAVPSAAAAGEAEAVVEAANQPEPVAAPADEAELIRDAADEPPAAAGGPEAQTGEPELRPGDVVIGTDNPFVVPLGAGEADVDIPDSEIEGPAVSRPVPSIAVTESDEGGISRGWAWLMWLGGTGIALILGLLLFGRRIREHFGPRSVAIPDVPARRRDDKPTARSIVSDIDFNFDADTLTPRKIDLDADLDDGTGLQDASEMDVAQDFGFSATDTAVDMEITEAAAKEEAPQPTDVIPPTARDEGSILDSEILPDESVELPELEATDEHKVDADPAPEEEEEDYSLSMRIDATRQFMDDNTATTKDLQAVLVSTDVHDPEDTSEYSISSEADYQILEQDYEEELTATQALNKEIEEAARALAEQMGEAESGDQTAEVPAPEERDPEITAELTSNLPESLDLTVDMPASDDDDTLDVDSVPVEPKKSEAS